MGAKLTLNGEEYEVELTGDQVLDIGKLKTGFGCANFGHEYYIPEVLCKRETETFFSSKDLCEDYTHAIDLFLKLSKWQATNDTKSSFENAYFIVFKEETNR